jgi:hypothetical protein
MTKGGKKPRAKGDRFERSLVAFFKQHGLQAERIPLSGSAGGSYRGDLKLRLLGADLILEAKHHASGFATLYRWLEGRDVLVLRRDCDSALVVARLDLAALIASVAQKATGGQ